MNWNQSLLQKISIASLLILMQCTHIEINSERFLSLLYLIETGGQCAYITKSGSTYTATGYLIAKNFCNRNYLGPAIFTDPELAKSRFDYEMDTMISIYRKAGSACNSYVTTLNSYKSSMTSQSIQTSANSSSTYCTQTGYLSQGAYFCKNVDSGYRLVEENARWISVADVKIDMMPNYQGTIDSLKYYHTTLGTRGMPSSAIDILRLTTFSEYKLLTAADAVAAKIAISSNTCVDAILTENTNLKNLWLLSSYYSSNNNFSTSWEAITTFLSCKYGNGVYASATSNSTAGVGICPTYYPQF